MLSSILCYHHLSIMLQKVKKNNNGIIIINLIYLLSGLFFSDPSPRFSTLNINPSIDGFNFPLQLQILRQPNRSRNLNLHRHSLRSNLLSPHLQNYLLQISQIHHRQSLQKARNHENRFNRSKNLYQKVKDEEDRPRRDFSQGI